MVTNATAGTAQYGSTVYVIVAAAATSKVALKVSSVDSSAATVANGLAKGSTLTTSDVTVSGFDTSVLTGKKGDAVDTATVQAALGKAVLKGNKTYYSNDGTAYHYTFAFNSDAFGSVNSLANYGDNLSAYYAATLVKGSATSNSTSDTSWIA